MTGSPEFQAIRREAEDALDQILRDTSAIDDGMQAMNAAADRARALARLDCWAPRWLQAAFQEVDRQARWAELRAAMLTSIAHLHEPRQLPDGRWVCQEDGKPYPCPTRKELLPRDENH